jgi:hypothetical protein
MTGTSSANPSKLEAAAQALAAELRTALASAPAVLSDRVAAFRAGQRSSERITVSTDALAGSLAMVVTRGDRSTPPGPGAGRLAHRAQGDRSHAGDRGAAAW